MSNHRGHVVAEQRRALFSSVDRVQLLAQAMGKPTGEIVHIGGLDFDLVPLSTFEALDIIELVDRYGSIISQVKNGGEIDEAEIARSVHAEGGRILNMVKKILRDATYIEDETQEQLFEEWFNVIPIVESLRALIPAIWRANALKKLGNEQPAEPVTIEATPADTTQSSETSQAS